MEGEMLTIPMMEESKWTSQRRRSSWAFRRRRGLESENPSFLAMSERSISRLVLSSAEISISISFVVGGRDLGGFKNDM